MVEHQSRKLGVVGSNPTGGIDYFDMLTNTRRKKIRSWQGSNLRGQSPLDFKSNALTTRPQLHMHKIGMKNLGKPKDVEMRGIEPRAFHMQSERSTTEPHPHATATMQEFVGMEKQENEGYNTCLLYTSPSPRDLSTSRMPSSA